MKQLIGMLMAAGMAVPAACAGERLMVVFYDVAGLETGDTEQAISASRRFFESVGLETEWIVCRSLDSCAVPAARAYVRVSLVSWTKGTILGFSNPDSAAAGYPQVYVFHPRASLLAARAHRPVGLVTACVMTHEILHSLGLGHAPYGIMRNAFDADDLAKFGRGPAMPSNQAEQLRAGARRLMATRVSYLPDGK